MEEALSQRTPFSEISNVSSSASSSQRTPKQSSQPPTPNLQTHHNHLSDTPSRPPSHETYLFRLDLVESYAYSTLDILSTHPPTFHIIDLISSCDGLLTRIGHVRDELQAAMALEQDNLADLRKQVCDLEAQMEGIEETCKRVHSAVEEREKDSHGEEQG
jgi:hypothetical protein